jgi:hypothetical protein
VIDGWMDGQVEQYRQAEAKREDRLKLCSRLAVARGSIILKHNHERMKSVSF